MPDANQRTFQTFRRPGRGAISKVGFFSGIYIYTCRCGLIDFRHFYELMYLSANVGNRAAVAAGIYHEAIAEEASRYAPEDITSNALGAYFGTQLRAPDSVDVFIDKLSRFLSLCDAVKWTVLTEEQKRRVIDYYAVDSGYSGSSHRRRGAGSDNDACGACAGRDSSFPFALDWLNAALIVGRR